MGCEIVALIGFIEETKVRFLRGTPRAKDLRRELDSGLRPFSMRCRGFDCRDNRVLYSCFTAGAGRE